MNGSTWSDSVGLHLNNDKSCVLNYVTKKSLNLFCALSRDSVILSVSSLSLLDVSFSSDFSWNLHVQNVVNK